MKRDANLDKLIQDMRQKNSVDNHTTDLRYDMSNLMEQVRELKNNVRTMKDIMIFFTIMFGISVVGAIIWGISFASKMASIF